MTLPLVGSPVDRRDGRLKVTGAAKYSAETIPQAVYGVMVGSTIATGRIVAIDETEARGVRGVVDVITHRNAPRLPNARLAQSKIDRVVDLMQDDRIRYDRQPIALVLADTFERATYAASLVRVRYEVGKPVTTVASARLIATVPNQADGKPSETRKGDADGALATAAVVVDRTYTTPHENHNPMEPHATIAAWHGDELTVYDATQGVFPTRKRLAEIFELPESKVRVICRFLGGGFGCKGSMWTHTALAALGARAIGRPVRIVLTRSEMFGSVGYRPPTRQRVALGASRDGTLTSVIHETTSTTSMFDTFVEPSSSVSNASYATPNLRTKQTMIRLDVPTPTFMRAPGESTGSFALESAMDELAYATGADPIELRLRNYADVEPISGKPWTSKSLRACYRAGADAFGWSRRDPRVRSTMRDGMLVGSGMATASYPSNRQPAAAFARVTSDGRFVVRCGTQDLGTGSWTVFAQLAAEALGVAFERVAFELGDTNFPKSPGSGGSQTAASVGSAVSAACAQLVFRAATVASNAIGSPLHGVDPAAVVARAGALVGPGGASETWFAIVARGDGMPLEATGSAAPPQAKDHAAHAFGAQFAEVAIDPELRTIRVTRLVGAFASGRILNEKLARSQYLGGMVWGVGMALLERTQTDERFGRIMNANLTEYLVPVNADVPTIDVVIVPEEDTAVNPIGVKGIGEIGITGGAAAIANAVYHATGVRVRDLPITLDKLV